MYYAPEAFVSEPINEGLARKEALGRKNEYLERVRGNTLAFDLGTDKSENAAFVDNGKLAAEISSSALINLFETGNDVRSLYAERVAGVTRSAQQMVHVLRSTTWAASASLPFERKRDGLRNGVEKVAEGGVVLDAKRL